MTNGESLAGGSVTRSQVLEMCEGDKNPHELDKAFKEWVVDPIGGQAEVLRLTDEKKKSHSLAELHRLATACAAIAERVDVHPSASVRAASNTFMLGHSRQARDIMKRNNYWEGSLPPILANNEKPAPIALLRFAMNEQYGSKARVLHLAASAATDVGVRASKRAGLWAAGKAAAKASEKFGSIDLGAKAKSRPVKWLAGVATKATTGAASEALRRRAEAADARREGLRQRQDYADPGRRGRGAKSQIELGLAASVATQDEMDEGRVPEGVALVVALEARWLQRHGGLAELDENLHKGRVDTLNINIVSRFARIVGAAYMPLLRKSGRDTVPGMIGAQWHVARQLLSIAAGAKATGQAIETLRRGDAVIMGGTMRDATPDEIEDVLGGIHVGDQYQPPTQHPASVSQGNGERPARAQAEPPKGTRAVMDPTSTEAKAIGAGVTEPTPVTVGASNKAYTEVLKEPVGEGAQPLDLTTTDAVPAAVVVSARKTQNEANPDAPPLETDTNIMFPGQAVEAITQYHQNTEPGTPAPAWVTDMTARALRQDPDVRVDAAARERLAAAYRPHVAERFGGEAPRDHEDLAHAADATLFEAATNPDTGEDFPGSVTQLYAERVANGEPSPAFADRTHEVRTAAREVINGRLVMEGEAVPVSDWVGASATRGAADDVWEAEVVEDERTGSVTDLPRTTGSGSSASTSTPSAGGSARPEAPRPAAAGAQAAVAEVREQLDSIDRGEGVEPEGRLIIAVALSAPRDEVDDHTRGRIVGALRREASTSDDPEMRAAATTYGEVDDPRWRLHASVSAYTSMLDLEEAHEVPVKEEVHEEMVNDVVESWNSIPESQRGTIPRAVVDFVNWCRNKVTA